MVDYNVRRPGGKLIGLDELDVLGMDFKNKKAYLCEVSTHLEGLLYGSNRESTAKTVRTKYLKMKEYANNYLADYFIEPIYMFWSPVVGPKPKTELEKIDGLELVINEKYAEFVSQLQEFAKKNSYDTGNPAMRVLQILGHLK